MDQNKVESLVRELLREFGEDPERPGLLETRRDGARHAHFGLLG